MKTNIKSSLSLILKRVEHEARLQKEADKKKRLASLKRACSGSVSKLNKLHVDVAKLEEDLQSLGLVRLFCEDDQYALSDDESRGIEIRINSEVHRLFTIRDNVLLHFGLSTEERRVTMINYFLDEVASSFPSISGLVKELRQ